MRIRRIVKLYLYLKHFPSRGAPLVGGTVKAVHGLASGLASCGADVTILCEGPDPGGHETEDGYRIRCFKNSVEKPSLRLAPELKCFINTKPQADLVILNGSFHPSMYALARLLFKNRIPYVVAPHMAYHPDLFRQRPILKRLYWRGLERRLLVRACAIQLLNAEHGAFLHALGVDNSTLVVANGCFARQAGRDAKKPRVHGSQVRLFFFGRIDSYPKALDVLISAVAALVPHRNVTLTLQGPDQGSRQLLVRKAAELSITDRVTFLEPDYTSSPVALLSQYDIFCLPSRIEGFNTAAIEAMLAERVLLVSRIDGIAQHVVSSNCGVVTEPCKSSVLSGLDSLLARQSEWDEMGRRGRQYALSNLNWNQIADAALRQYEILLTRNAQKAQRLGDKAYG
jgi:glycosyltransferase involved in cell wall biosynthesis